MNRALASLVLFFCLCILQSSHTHGSDGRQAPRNEFQYDRAELSYVRLIPTKPEKNENSCVKVHTSALSHCGRFVDYEYASIPNKFAAYVLRQQSLHVEDFGPETEQAHKAADRFAALRVLHAKRGDHFKGISDRYCEQTFWQASCGLAFPKCTDSTDELPQTVLSLSPDLYVDLHRCMGSTTTQELTLLDKEAINRLLAAQKKYPEKFFRPTVTWAVLISGSPFLYSMDIPDMEPAKFLIGANRVPSRCYVVNAFEFSRDSGKYGLMSKAKVLKGDGTFDEDEFSMEINTDLNPKSTVFPIFSSAAFSADEQGYDEMSEYVGANNEAIQLWIRSAAAKSFGWGSLDDVVLWNDFMRTGDSVETGKLYVDIDAVVLIAHETPTTPFEKKCRNSKGFLQKAILGIIRAKTASEVALDESTNGSVMKTLPGAVFMQSDVTGTKTRAIFFPTITEEMESIKVLIDASHTRYGTKTGRVGYWMRQASSDTELSEDDQARLFPEVERGTAKVGYAMFPQKFADDVQTALTKATSVVDYRHIAGIAEVYDKLHHMQIPNENIITFLPQKEMEGLESLRSHLGHIGMKKSGADYSKVLDHVTYSGEDATWDSVESLLLNGYGLSDKNPTVAEVDARKREEEVWYIPDSEEALLRHPHENRENYFISADDDHHTTIVDNDWSTADESDDESEAKRRDFLDAVNERMMPHLRAAIRRGAHDDVMSSATPAFQFEAERVKFRVSPNDNVLVYFTGHGELGSLKITRRGSGRAKYQTSILTRPRLANLIRALKDTCNQLVFYVNACYSASMFEGMETVMKDSNAYAMTSGGYDLVKLPGQLLELNPFNANGIPMVSLWNLAITEDILKNDVYHRTMKQQLQDIVYLREHVWGLTRAVFSSTLFPREMDVYPTLSSIFSGPLYTMRQVRFQQRLLSLTCRLIMKGGEHGRCTKRGMCLSSQVNASTLIRDMVNHFTLNHSANWVCKDVLSDIKMNLALILGSVYGKRTDIIHTITEALGSGALFDHSSLPADLQSAEKVCERLEYNSDINDSLETMSSDQLCHTLVSLGRLVSSVPMDIFENSLSPDARSDAIIQLVSSIEGN